jgi:hypothetical protein
MTKWTSQLGACGLTRVVEQSWIRRALWKTISEVDNYHEMVEEGGEAVPHRNSRSGSRSFRRAKTGELGPA